MTEEIINYYDRNSGKRYEIIKSGETITFKYKSKKYKMIIPHDLDHEEIRDYFFKKLKILSNKEYTITNDFKLVFSEIPDVLRLKSKKLNKEILIPINEFVSFLNDNNVSKDCESLDDILSGINILIDKNGNFHIENKFFKELIKEDFIQEELIEGQRYLLNKEEVIYLGMRYISTLFDNKYIKFDRISKIKKKQYILKDDIILEINHELERTDSENILSKVECDEKLNRYYIENLNITYFNKENFKGIIDYGFIDFIESDKSPFAKINGSYYTKVQNSKNLKNCSNFERHTLFVKNSFYFRLNLNGQSFNYVEAVPLYMEGIEEVNLQRIGIIS